MQCLPSHCGDASDRLGVAAFSCNGGLVGGEADSQAAAPAIVGATQAGRQARDTAWPGHITRVDSPGVVLLPACEVGCPVFTAAPRFPFCGLRGGPRGFG
jgi:hypothetical protein